MPPFGKFLVAVFALLAAIPAAPHAHAQDTGPHAVAVAYHRFGDSRYPSTNTPIADFEAQLNELATGGYNVLPLLEIVEAIESGTPLPPRSVAITIDDAYLSVYKEAFPRLMQYGFPFTLFIATKAVDQGFRDYANWDQIREMQAAGATIGSQTHSHPHLHRLSDDEVRREIKVSNARFLEELGRVPQLHAYPYGEYSPATRAIIKEAGFKAAFGQHSGVMHASIHPFEYPRFAFNEAYGSLGRFRTAINAGPIPVSDIVPESSVLSENVHLTYGFTVGDGIEPLANLRCYATDASGAMDDVQTILLGRRVEVRLPRAFTGERGRINCTMPYYVDGRNTGNWRWFGRQMIKP